MSLLSILLATVTATAIPNTNTSTSAETCKSPIHTFPAPLLTPKLVIQITSNSLTGPTALGAINPGCRESVGRPGGIYVCTGDNFTGDCHWQAPPHAWQNCHYFTPDAMWRSVGPNHQTYCVFYEGFGCVGKVPRLSIPFGRIIT
ncbi:hypothetical protein CC86DRAFT_406612 [Ophiobolus disseminans]|uniref:Uncharacterized protein n=1 Tax=Ophiobolus disseminans TaxID=1469910 RepID=A0A6A7A0K6_9PLEO|nr:hypothetical protein CC86DRAFT_406612 [Ophiobolus disseminans]